MLIHTVAEALQIPGNWLGSARQVLLPQNQRPSRRSSALHRRVRLRGACFLFLPRSGDPPFFGESATARSPIGDRKRVGDAHTPLILTSPLLPPCLGPKERDRRLPDVRPRPVPGDDRGAGAPQRPALRPHRPHAHGPEVDLPAPPPGAAAGGQGLGAGQPGRRLGRHLRQVTLDAGHDKHCIRYN